MDVSVFSVHNVPGTGANRCAQGLHLMRGNCCNQMPKFRAIPRKFMPDERQFIQLCMLIFLFRSYGA